MERQIGGIPNPDSDNPQQLTSVEVIVPGIKPQLPMEPKERYNKIRAAGAEGAAYFIKRGIVESIKLREFFNPFSGQIVVDLGPGDTVTGYEISALSGAKAYVAVEPYYWVECQAKFFRYDRFPANNQLKKIPHDIVEADALSFLKRLPDKSVSIFASQMESVMKKDYEISLGKEIQRVLHPQGAFIEFDSEFHLDKNLFQRDLFDQNSDDSAYLYFDLEKYQLKT